MAKIIVDPKIRFGKPIVAGTRITVEEVIGALAGGMDFGEIEKEYGLKKEQILSAEYRLLVSPTINNHC